MEVATDYTKKKNVFRLTTNNHASEFLFQAEDSDTMWSWIQALRSSSDTEVDYVSTQLFQVNHCLISNDTQILLLHIIYN